MIKLRPTYIALLCFMGLNAQIDPNLLLGLTGATTTEMNAIGSPIEGSLLYNSTLKRIYLYDGTNWVPTNNDNWLMNGNVAPSGSFLGTTNDALMDLRSNNISIMQFGRRQTLGLVDSYPDYTDGDQYLTYLRGNNGVSALQFQADAASFYKPMFYTNSDGNFRLKGSAAGTDFFEIGSAGTANNGEVEFIIGDDGAEPFIFKRYDYRDGLLRELLRIQGASDTQDAKPRVGIATGALANSTLQVNGSLSLPTLTPNSNITLDESHYTVIINSNLSVTLPAASSATGRIYVLKNTTNAPRTISTYINGTGGNATQIGAQSTLWLQSNGSGWHSISSASLNKFVQTVSGNASFTNNTWNTVIESSTTWNQAKGTGTTPSYNTSGQAGIPITSDATLTKFTMKNDFNGTTGGTQYINLSVLRNGSYINIGTYTLSGVSTNVSIHSQTVSYVLEENDLLVWACRTVGGTNRTSLASLTFEFVN